MVQKLQATGQLEDVLIYTCCFVVCCCVIMNSNRIYPFKHRQWATMMLTLLLLTPISTAASLLPQWSIILISPRPCCSPLSACPERHCGALSEWYCNSEAAPNKVRTGLTPKSEFQNIYYIHGLIGIYLKYQKPAGSPGQFASLWAVSYYTRWTYQ
jgi:hypothetical protein